METASRRQTQGVVQWLSCSDVVTSVKRSTGSWPTCSRVRVGSSSCAARRAWARAPCWPTCLAGSPMRRAGEVGGSRVGRRGGVGNGPGLQRPASAVRAPAGPPRGAAGPATRRARDRVRAERWSRARPVPGGTGHADAGGAGRRAAAAGLHRRRRTVAGRRLRAAPRVRGPPPAGRAGRAGVRGAHRHRRRRAGRPARAGDPRAQRRRRAAAAAGPRARPDRRGRHRSDHRGEPRQPARAPGVAAHLGGGRPGRGIRAARQSAGGQQDRAQLRRSVSSCCRPTPGCSSSPRPRNPSAIRCCSAAPSARWAST